MNLAYEVSGPKKGEIIFLLHGWPDSPRTWDRVLPPLHEAGFRTIAPYLRGYGPSTFREPLFGRKPLRTGQPVAFAQDVMNIANGLILSSFEPDGDDKFEVGGSQRNAGRFNINIDIAGVSGGSHLSSASRPRI